MFLIPRFVPKTIEELRGQGNDVAELARQEGRLKQQFLDIREYHRRVLPTGIATTLLPEEEEEEEQPEGEEEPPASTNGAETVEQNSEDLSDEMVDVDGSASGEGSDWHSDE